MLPFTFNCGNIYFESSFYVLSAKTEGGLITVISSDVAIYPMIHERQRAF